MTFLKIIASLVPKNLQFRYFCYSLRKAEVINLILLWALIPIGILMYYLMYTYLAAEDVRHQWYVLFVGNALQSFFMSCLIFYYFKGTRHFGIATSVLIYFLFKLICEILNVSQKMYWVDAMWKLLIMGLVSFAIWDYFKRCKHDKDTN